MHSLRTFFGITFVLLWALNILPSSAAQDVPPPLAKMSNVIGQAVESKLGNQVGQITDVVIQAGTGDMAYAVLAAGGFLGLGEKLFAIPWRALQQSAGAKTFRLEMTEEQITQAPAFDRDRWPDLEDKHWCDTIHAYYGQPPYWGKRLPAETPRPTAEQATQRLLRASHVLQSRILNPQGQQLGDIKEVVIDTTAGTVVYALLGSGGFLGLGDKLFAIPWHALQQSEGLGTFTLDVDKAALQAAPGFDKDRWPTQADTRWGG